MVLTIARDTPDLLMGAKNVTTGTIAFDSSYPTGGEALTPANIGLNYIRFIIFEPTLGYVLTYDYTNQLVLAYYYDYDAGADGAAIQVANETDLSGLTGVKWFAIGD